MSRVVESSLKRISRVGLGSSFLSLALAAQAAPAAKTRPKATSALAAFKEVPKEHSRNIAVSGIGQDADDGLSLEFLFLGQGQGRVRGRAAGDAREDALLPAQPARHLQGFF